MPRRNIFDDDRAPVGMVLRDARVQEVLHLVLKVSVHRQLDVTTVLGLHRRLLAAGHDGAVRGDLKGLRAGRTGEQRVELGLHARGALPLGVDRPNNGGCHVTVGVFALEDGLPLDAINIKLADLAIGHSIHVALDVHVGGVTQHHAAKLRLIHAEDGGQEARRFRGTSTDLVTVIVSVNEGANVHLVHRDVVRLDRVRQDDARSIGDRAACSRDLRRGGTHTLALSGQRRPLDDLQLNQAHATDTQSTNKDAYDPSRTGDDGIHRYSPSGLLRGSPSLDGTSFEGDEARLTRGHHAVCLGSLFQLRRRGLAIQFRAHRPRLGLKLVEDELLLANLERGLSHTRVKNHRRDDGGQGDGDEEHEDRSDRTARTGSLDDAKFVGFFTAQLGTRCGTCLRSCCTHERSFHSRMSSAPRSRTDADRGLWSCSA